MTLIKLRNRGLAEGTLRNVSFNLKHLAEHADLDNSESVKEYIAKKSCGHWNRVPVNKIFIEQTSPEPKVRVLIPMYEPLETVKCKKCGKIIAEPISFILLPLSRHKRQIQGLKI